MSAPLSAKSQIVDKDGRPTRELTSYLQALLTGVINRTSYTADQLATMTPAISATAFCTDSSINTFNDVLVGGGAFVVPVHGDGAAWRVG